MPTYPGYIKMIVEGVDIPTFMRKWVPKYGRSPDFLEMAKLWREEDEDEIVRLALDKTHPIEPLKQVALDILKLK